MTTPRLLPVQKNYLEGMKILLELYYLLKLLPKDKWFSDNIIRLIARLFTLTISNFSKSIFYWDGFYYHLRYGKSGTGIKINEGDFEKLLKMLDDFYKESLNGTLEEAYRITKSTMSVDILPVESKQLKKLGHELYFPIKKINQSFSCKIYKGKTDEDIYKDINSDLGQLPIYHEIFHIRIDIDSRLIYTLSSLTDISEEEEIIESPPQSQETSFYDVIRYIMAKFYAVFGSFNRIKICKNNDCKKLFVEKKLGTFCCNTKCRMKYNVNRQPKEIHLCRERQNNWLRNKLGREDFTLEDKDNLQAPDHVQKLDCDNCTKPRESGLCLCLRSKNSKSLLIIGDYPKRAKIRSKFK